MIAVVDYCKGNLKSVERGLIAVGGEARITDDPVEIERAEAIVLPGVGAFADAMASMNAAGQTEALRAAIGRGVPFLGICLGLHLLFTAGVEGAGKNGAVSGLGIIDGLVTKMPSTDAAGTAYKVPHVGWNSIEPVPGAAACPLLAGVKPGEYFYFTHSYIAPQNPFTVTTTTHSVTFPSTVAFGDRVFGVQFHPEKSSDAGALVLKNFLDIVRSVS